MQLAIISDTHIPAREQELPEPFRDRIAAADHAVHADDFETADVLADVRSLATELTAVNGNVDPTGIGLSSVAATTLGGVTFVVTHATLNPVERPLYPADGMVVSREDWLDAIADTARVRTRAWASDDPVVGIGDHSHQAEDEVHEGIRVLNPGSATGADPAERATMMTVEATDGEVDVSVHEA